MAADSSPATGHQRSSALQLESCSIGYERMLGYNCKNIEQLDRKYICQLCFRILREPVQLQCGHRQCRACVESRLQNEKLKCPECHQETHQSEISPDRGFKTDMKDLNIHCAYCDWEGALKTLEDHLAQTHRNPSCDYCGKTFGSIDSLELHQTTDCLEVSKPCALRSYGCSESVRQGDMIEHCRSMEHQTAIIAFIRRDATKFTDDFHDRGITMDTDGFSHTTTSSYDDSRPPAGEIDEATNVLTGGLQALTEDAQRLGNEAHQLHNEVETLNKKLASLRSSIQEHNVSFDALGPKLDALQQELSSLQLKVEDSQSVSYDGTYTWRIPTFKEKMTDAQMELLTSIYSPPFYSSPTGYKMRARLYLYGDGSARGTHISLFFVLMRGEYDAILKFPFTFKIIFCLFDQTPAQKHIVESFRPDPKSNSFQRPRSEMNIASGVPKFCSLNVLQDEGSPYVRDNTIIIKIMVDFIEIPKAMQPFVFGINPGLPATVHQTTIKEEVKRRSGQTPTASASSETNEKQHNDSSDLK